MKKTRALFFLSIICFLFSCTRNDSTSNVLKVNSSNVKYFDDAKEFSDTWSKENTVIVHILDDPNSLHPTNGTSSTRNEILFYTQRTLLNTDFANQTFSPGLVESLPEISDDGLRYKYHLRDNISWDDGKFLSSQDILFTAKAFKCPLVNDQAIRSYWGNVVEIITDTLHPLDFTIVMKRRHIHNVSFLTSFPILERIFYDSGNVLSHFTLQQFNDTAFHPDVYPKLKEWAKEFNDDKYGREPQKLNGLGMYKVQEWASGQYITLIKKINHWTQNSTDYHDLAFPEKIIFKINRDEASQILQFRLQEMDVSTNLTLNAFVQLSSDANFQKNYNIALMPTYNYSYMCFNERPDGIKRKKLFDDVRTRRAIAMLTPVEKIRKLLYGQFSKECLRIVSNVSPLKREFNNELKPIIFNNDSSQKLLLQAGWLDSDNDGILDKNVNGEKIKLAAELYFPAAPLEMKDVALLIKEEMAKAGIQINPVAIDPKLIPERAKVHDFDLFLGIWNLPSTQEDFTQLWHTSNWANHGSNYPGFGSPESDALIDSIKYELNDSIRYGYSRKLQKIVYDDQPYVFLFSTLRRNVIHKRFGNQMVFSEKPGVIVNMLWLVESKMNN